MMSPQLKRAIAVSMIMGSELAVMIVVSLFIGYYGGRYFNFAEWGATIGAFVGFSVWIWRLISTKKYLL